MTKVNKLIDKIYENPVEIINFYKEILKEDVFIITNSEKNNNEEFIEFDKETKELELVLIEKTDKTPIMPIFGSLEDLHLSQIVNKEIVKIPFKDILFNINNLQIVINPYSKKSKEFSLVEIEDLKKGNIFNSDVVPNKLFYLLKNTIDTQSEYEKFYKEVYKSNVFVYVHYDEEDKMSFVSLVNNKTNETIVPIFCSLEDAITMNPNVAIQKMSLLDILTHFKDEKNIKIVLNPNSTYHKIFTNEEVNDIVSNKILKVISSQLETPITHVNINQQEGLNIRNPQKDYDKLIDNTSMFFDKHGKVYVAYLVETLVNDSYEPLIVVDVEIEGEFLDFVKELNTHYNEFKETSTPLVSRFNFNNELSKHLVEHIKPFYIKK